MASVVSERYALSLYEVAKEENLAAELLEEMRAVAGVFEQYPDCLKILTTPSIRFEEKKDVLNQVFGGRVHPYVLNFLMLITEKRRIGLIGEMADAYKELYYQEEGICEVTAVTAVALSESQAERLREKMQAVTGKKIILDNRVDRAVLGGVLLRIENKQIDASIRARLNELSRQLTQIIA